MTQGATVVRAKPDSGAGAAGAGSSRGKKPMPVISMFYGIIIRLYLIDN
jgi:hypothetical protein